MPRNPILARATTLRSLTRVCEDQTVIGLIGIRILALACRGHRLFADVALRVLALDMVEPAFAWSVVLRTRTPGAGAGPDAVSGKLLDRAVVMVSDTDAVTFEYTVFCIERGIGIDRDLALRMGFDSPGQHPNEEQDRERSRAEHVDGLSS